MDRELPLRHQVLAERQQQCVGENDPDGKTSHRVPVATMLYSRRRECTQPPQSLANYS
jgi:hypothetical protein